MIYSKFQNLEISSLGMGCMRLPKNGPSESDIDYEAVEKMTEYAIGHGINYFDTAWGYHNGQSETVMGKVLKKYPRSSFYLASKFPGYDLSNIGKVEEIFEEQLRKCGVEYFDFYMFHNVCELNINEYLDPQYGIFDYLMKQKKNGRIRHLGFSAHGNLDTMKRFIDAYGSEMEFCQIQLNWLDWDFQNAKEKVALLNTLGIPIWVMEPLRGGSLVNPDQTFADRLNKIADGRSLPELAFRYLQSIPGVTVTLSGMSNFDQLAENIAVYENNSPLSASEVSALLGIAHDMTKKKTLPCTKCSYCTSHCPLGLDIPFIIELYNEHTYSDGGFIAPMALDSLEDDKKPSACIGCQSCEAVCPQNIKISEMMADFSK